MIGNDIVDLQLAGLQSNWKRKGWLQKLFLPSEINNIIHSKDPTIQVWKFWSMKEATYKAHQRRFNLPPTYNPKSFECFFDTVKIDKYEYQTTTETDARYVYSTASIDIVHSVSEIFTTTIIKEKLVQTISKEIQIPVHAIQICKNPHGIPMIKIDNKLQHFNFSITHHGPFAAFIIEL